MCGIDQNVINHLTEIFANHAKIEKVILYGSRAIGNYKDGSDIDITLIGDELTLKTIFLIMDEIEELNLPYLFDISIYSQINNESLKEHINRVGKILYTKE